MKAQNKAYIFAIIVVLFWSTIGAAFKLTLEYVNFEELVFYSTLVSLLFLSLTLISQRKHHLIRSLTRKELLYSALMGFLNPFLYYLILIKAYSILMAQEVVVLNYLWPVVLVLLSIPLLKQRIGPKSIIAILISFTGSYIVATQGDIFNLRFNNLTGVLLAFGSTFIWALYWIYNLKDRRDAVVKLFLNFVFGACYVFAAALLTGHMGIPNGRAVLGGAYIGVFEMGITFVFWLKALSLSRTTAGVANLVYLIPFMSVTLIGLVVGETIYVSTVAGLVLIVTGIIVQKTGKA